MLDFVHKIQSNKWINLVANVCFYIGLSLEIVMVIIDKSRMVNPVEGRMFQIAFLLFFMKLLLTKYEIREYAAIFLFCVFGLFVDRFGDRNEILRMAVFVFSLKDIDVKRALKITFLASFVGSLLILILSVTGIYGDMLVTKEYEGVGNVSRYAFGMGNANAFHCMFFVLMLLFLYLYFEKLRWWIFISLFLLNTGVYLLTDSRTGMLAGMISLAAYGFLKLTEGKNKKTLLKIAGAGSVVTYVSMILLSVYFAYDTWKLFYKRFSLLGAPEKSIIYILDRALTGRISTLSGTDGWKGAMVSWEYLPTPNHTDYFDLGYVRVFYWYGIIAALVIFAVFLWLYIFLLKKGCYRELIFLTVIGIYTLMEAHFVSVYISRCYPLFIMGAYIFEMLNFRKTDAENYAG